MNVVKVLKVVKALDERFATDYMVTYHYRQAYTADHRCTVMKDLLNLELAMIKPDHYWNSLIRQMLLEGLLRKDIEEYGVLKITKKGEAFLKKPKSFKIVLNNLFEEANADDEEGSRSKQRLQQLMRNCLKC